MNRKVLDTELPDLHFPHVTQPARTTEPPALHDRALQDLSYIRKTMEGASAFTDVSGAALVVIGALAVVVAYLASLQPTLERWLALWIATAIAVESMNTSAIAMPIKARAANRTARKKRISVLVMKIGCKTQRKVPGYPLSFRGWRPAEAALPTEP